MFFNTNNRQILNCTTKHHQMCAMRFMQLSPKERAMNKNIIIGGYKIRQMSYDTAYLVPKGQKESWSNVLFFNCPEWDYPY